MYILSAVHRSVNQGDTLLAGNIAHAEYLCGRNIVKNRWSFIKMVLKL